MDDTILNRMLTIAYSNSIADTVKFLDNGFDLVMTHNLDDMTNPTKTIYCVTGADFTTDKNEAKRHGYLNSKGEPLELNNNKGHYPIAINSEKYYENFHHRLQYLRKFTKWPFGLHVGGSKNMIEHTYPIGVGHSKSYWCYGFEKTHTRDHSETLSQYQAEVWEDITNDQIEKAEEVFPHVKMITTAFSCPSGILSNMSITSLSSGSELWYVLKRMSTIHKRWYNIFFNIFSNSYTKTTNESRFMDMTASISSYDLRRNIISDSAGLDGLLGKKNAKICEEAKLHGTPYLSYTLRLHGGILINMNPDDYERVAKKVDLIKKYKV